MSQAREIIEKCFNTHPKSQRFLVESLEKEIEKALLEYGQQEREKAIRECADISSWGILSVREKQNATQFEYWESAEAESIQRNILGLLKTTEGTK